MLKNANYYYSLRLDHEAYHLEDYEDLDFILQATESVRFDNDEVKVIIY